LPPTWCRSSACSPGARPLFILVVLKTAVDALLHVAVDVRPHAKLAAVVT
jgi:hypothetical protein